MKIFSLIRRNWLQESRSPFFFALTLFTTPLVLLLFWGLSQTKVSFASKFLVYAKPEIMTSVQVLNILESLKSRSTVYSSKIEFDNALDLNPDDFGLSILEIEDKPLPAYEIRLIPRKKGISDQEKSAIELEIRSLWMSKTGINLKWEWENEENEKTKRANKNLFQAFAPRLLVFLTLMGIFSTTMMLTREIESGVFIKYKMAELPLITYLSGMFGFQLILNSFSIIISSFLLILLGFSSDFSLLKMIILIWLGSLTSFGIGLSLARFANDSAQGFLISSFCMFVLLLASGIVFPKPDLFLYFLPPFLVVEGIQVLEQSGTSPFSFLQISIFLLTLTFFYGGFGILIFQRVYSQDTK